MGQGFQVDEDDVKVKSKNKYVNKKIKYIEERKKKRGHEVEKLGGGGRRGIPLIIDYKRISVGLYVL